LLINFSIQYKFIPIAVTYSQISVVLGKLGPP